MRIKFLILVLIAAAGNAAVKQWDRFEASVENKRAYADPYRDVQLLVTYRSPDARETRFWGFGYLLSVHNPTGDDPFKDQAWHSYGVLQGPKTLDLAVLSSRLLRNHHPSKPLLAQETLWPGNTVGHPKYTAVNVRKNGFVIQMSATALNFTDMNGTSSSGFSGSMDLNDKVQGWHDVIRKVWDFFESVPFERMKPRQDLVDNGYCLADEGREYLVHLDRPGTVNVRTDPETFRAEWINAQDTRDIHSANRPYTTPDDGDDWLLWLRKR